jgi:nucleotide-binding universal stress UspA family protein
MLAVDIGVRLAHDSGRDIVLVHGAPEIAADLLGDTSWVSHTSAEFARSDAVLDQALQCADAAGVTAVPRIIGEHGRHSLPDAIVGTANGMGATMIVLGSRGRSLAGEALLGSISHAVAQLSSVPVLIVHAPPG